MKGGVRLYLRPPSNRDRMAEVLLNISDGLTCIRLVPAPMVATQQQKPSYEPAQVSHGHWGRLDGTRLKTERDLVFHEQVAADAAANPDRGAGRSALSIRRSALARRRDR